MTSGPQHDRPDPRLEIPEILRTPVRQPSIDPVTGDSLSASGEKNKGTVDTTAMGKAWAMGFDFVFTIVAGVGLGWLIDYLAGSAPVGILLGVAAGFASGLMRMIRTANRMQHDRDRARTGRK